MEDQDSFTAIRAALKRGERDSAKRELAGLLMRFPKNETGWMLMAQAVNDEKQKKECYERAIAINPKNLAAKAELVRMEYPGYTFDPQRGIVPETSKKARSRFIGAARFALIGMILLFLFAGGTLTYAKNNPESPIAKIIPKLPGAGPAGFDPLQYDSPEEAFIQFANEAAETGMEGAPAKPGQGVAPSVSDGGEKIRQLQASAPGVGERVTVSVSEYDATSMIAYTLSQNPQLPIQNVQVFFRDGQVKIWCIVVGDGNSTSALLTGNIVVTGSGIPSFAVDVAQIGQQNVGGATMLQAQLMLNQMIASSISSNAPGAKVENVVVDRGYLTATVSR